MTTAAKGLFRTLADCGHAPADGPVLRRQKSVITGASLLKSAMCPLWGALFFAVGAVAAAIVPLVYLLFTSLSVARLSRDKDISGFRTRQAWFIFVLPCAVTIALGGLHASGVVLLWSFLAPLIALLFHGPASSVRWLLGFFVAVVAALFLDALGVLPIVPMSASMRSVFTALNVIAVCGISYTAVRYYAMLLEEEQGVQAQLNGELAMKNAELDRKNQELAEQARRVAESQQALVHSEKLAAMGQLVAGVAHELNTPLGAIRASVGNLSAATGEIIAELPSTLARATPAEVEALARLLARGAATSADLSSAEERKLRRRLRAELEASDVEGAADAADVLVQLRVTSAADCGGLEKSPRLAPLLRAAYGLSALRRNCATIGFAADRAAKMVFALKTYAHPGATEERRAVSVDETVETVLTLYQNKLKNGVEVRRRFAAGVVVEGHHDALIQVWTNLVHNALQAMESRGVLELAITTERGRARVEVIDDGKGIPASVLPRIFDPFFTTKSAGEGTGLGLSICKDIVANHGGSIAVESAPGRTVFTVELPLARSTTKPAEFEPPPSFVERSQA
ncbi:MAG: ATP-binding protein [Polyangiaceae bacterium]